MRRILELTLASAVVLALASCGGASDPFTAGDSGSAPDAGDASHGGNDGGGGGDSGTDCTALQAEVDSLQAQAQACCPTCNIVQCFEVVQGACCPISVNSKDSAATKAFLAALAQLQQSCPSACPAISCEKAPSSQCAANGECR